MMTNIAIPLIISKRGILYTKQEGLQVKVSSFAKNMLKYRKRAIVASIIAIAIFQTTAKMAGAGIMAIAMKKRTKK